MTSQTDAPVEPCACESCSATDLPVNPFLALRVAYGMLLGEDDFRTLMGNPRGKQMLHAAWLHGCGVVWGYRVSVASEPTLKLKVSTGLAVDGLGRELLADTSWCLDVRQWLTKQHDAIDQTCRTQTLHACLIARHDCCPTTPVPTLADPCDITRKHDDYSRVAEGVRLELRLGRCPGRPDRIIGSASCSASMASATTIRPARRRPRPWAVCSAGAPMSGRRRCCASSAG